VLRLTVQAGKFAVLDIFDGNAYAKDTRKDFMNWSMWAPGAFDYSADKVGLTYGATAELNQKQWALRSGYFLMQSVANSSSFDTRVFERGTYVLELETRYSLSTSRERWCGPSAGSTAPFPEAIATRSTTPHLISISRKPARAASLWSPPRSRNLALAG
jgi:Carbohydrate-selective porin, OprB family